VTTVQSHRDSKVMTWNPRKPPNQRSCFLFRIEDYEKLSATTSRRWRNHCLLLWSLRLCRERVCPRTRIAVRVPQPPVSRNAISAERDNCLAARTEFSAKRFVDRPPASTELSRRAAETDPEAASLLSAHPRNVDGVILLVHLRG
jgi:hypothetical protein